MRRLNGVITMLFFLCVCLAFSALRVKVVLADVVVENSSTLVLKSETLKSNKTIKVPDWQAQKIKAEQEAVKRERQSRGAYAGNYSDNGTYSGNGSNVAGFAQQFLGKPYVWGASGPNAFDCSGFTAYVYSSFGISLPHYTGSQVQEGRAVAKSNLREGDLVFFNTYENFGHVGIYIGGGKFVHASTGSKKVTISSLDGAYYNSRYAGARRIID